MRPFHRFSRAKQRVEARLTMTNLARRLSFIVSRRRFLCPEVIQTSLTDCGPACLKAVLEGFGVAANYARLREAVQTDVDGTSIDTIETVLNDFGVEARQLVVPIDHLMLRESCVLPAIVIFGRKGKTMHFIIVWRRVGPWVQLMNPAGGRAWVRLERLRSEVFVHEQDFDAEAWHQWFAQEQATALRRRVRDMTGPSAIGLVESALAGDDWRDVAGLDAATRFAAAMVRCGAISPGRQSAALVHSLVEEMRREPERSLELVPAPYWSAAPVGPPGQSDREARLRGGVVLSMRGAKRSQAPDVEALRSLSPELEAAVTESEPRAVRSLLEVLLEDGWSTLVLAVAAAAVAGVVTVAEALLFRSFFDLGSQMTTAESRVAALGVVALFLMLTFALAFPLRNVVQRLARHLDLRLRQRFLAKLPKLPDNYFRTRPVSDMVERCHAIAGTQRVPSALVGLATSAASLIATTVGLWWLDARTGMVAVACSLVAFVLPFIFANTLAERDMRVRNRGVILMQKYLDALLGLVAVRAHSAERTIDREQEHHLTEWAKASLRLLDASVILSALQALASIGLAVGVVAMFVSATDGSGPTLLVVWWALGLSRHAGGVAGVVRGWPSIRNTTLRVMEPIAAREDELRLGGVEHLAVAGDDRGAWIYLESVSVVAAGNEILRDVTMDIPAGSHVAIIGKSGAGKSSLLGLLLGFHRPRGGLVTVDGEALDATQLARIRAQTAWVDPAAALWNRSLVDNLCYGADGPAIDRAASAIERASLLDVLERLPDGLATKLGEGGALVSGGEGQRVRLGRAMVKERPRLVLLDEPFRGLDRSVRARLAEQCREQWVGSTLLFVSHDIEDALRFPRVLVVEDGQIVEDGSPGALLTDPRSHCAQLLLAEQDVHRHRWGAAGWRRITVDGGRVHTDEDRAR